MYIIYYNNNTYANQNCMALALVRCSIKVDQGGTLYAKARVSLVSWEGGSHAVLFMVPLGPTGARPMAQALRLSFVYYYNNTVTSLCFSMSGNPIFLIDFTLFRKHFILKLTVYGELSRYNYFISLSHLYSSLCP